MIDRAMKGRIIVALSKKFELEPDGHGIYHPQYYYDMGLPKKFVDQYNENYQSGNTHKSTIYKDGKTLESADGVYNLSILEGICSLLDLSTECMFQGRGRIAEVLVGRIRQSLN